MMKKKSLPKILIVGLILALVLPLLSLVPEVGATQPPAPPKPPMEVKTAVDEALAKIKPELREKAVAGGKELVDVFVTAVEGTDVSQYMTQSFTRPFVSLGEQTTFGFVRAGSLLKLASLPGVTSVQPIVFGPSAGPIPPPDPDVQAPVLSAEQLRARMAELKAIDTPWSGEMEYGQSKQPTGWFDVGPGHKSSKAWAKGYTGKGVRVAVLDQGVDFGHPDLMGTQALVKDEASPYYGWPMAFSPFSMLLYAYDQYLGYSYVADGFSWYADTSETPHVVHDLWEGTARLRYTPLAGSSGERSFEHEYIFNDTSQSGVYHIGSHPDDTLLEVFGERVAVLVVDENEEGVYDTVYVDLDNDYDFRDEKPVTKDSPISYRDMDGDSYADISGGLVYFIADGVNPIPIADWYWGLGWAGNGAQDFGEPDNGSLVAFEGALDLGSDHGTLCASNVVGQGVINGGAPTFRDLPGDGTPGGMVWGGAPDAEMVGISNIYWNFDESRIDAYIFSVYGYDGVLGSGDEIQITSNSYGESDVDNDGWEYYGRYVDRRQRLYSPTTSFLFSTGNGAPGYGTVAPPSPATGMGIGASTQMGSTGWDSITDTVQITYGDVIGWSNRGPGARGSAGVSVVADGASAAGAEPINMFGFDGWYAWTTWGGTSRSAPVAMGNLALVYQAFEEKNDRWPTYDEARAIFMSGATNLNYDVFVQGAGSVNADRATDVAAGLYGVYVTPESWRAGDYRGTEYPGFANIVKPGDTNTQTFTIYNPGSRDITVSLSDDVLTKIGEEDITFTSLDVSEESSYSFNRPNYILDDLKDDIPAGTDLMVVRVIFPFDQFDPDGDYDYENRWRVLVYDWTDIDGDGVYWNDLDEDGVVDSGEMEEGEYIRFTYGYPSGNYLEARVQRPLERMNDLENGGILLGLQHRTASDLVPTTDLTIKIEFYQHSDWDLLALSDASLTVPAGDSATFEATVSVPADTAIGIYEGAIFVDDPGFLYQIYLPLIFKGGGTASAAAASAQRSAITPANAHQTVVPVVVNVAADFTGSVELGGAAADDADALYNNGVVRGGFDWGWRPESGDWRFFFLDVPTAPATGTKLIVRDVWVDDAPPTDLDTIVMGPTIDRFTDPADSYYDPTYYGPYTLDTVGKSTNKYLGSGKWRFDTATGGAEEWVTAPLQEGLHLIAEHNVLFSGQKFGVPFTKTVATVSVEPPAIEITTMMDSGSAPIVFTSGLELAGLSVEAYGLSTPQVLADQLAYQDDPNDPAMASYTYIFDVAHASSLAVSTGDAPGQDLDLFLYYDANDDGVFDYPGEVIGSSTTPTADEFVSAKLPADGSYMAAVHGWAVSPSPSTFTFTVDIVQGYDLAISGVPVGTVPADTPIQLTMSYSKTMVAGETWKGEIFLGPTVAPGALSIPVTIHRVGPLNILHNNDGESDLLADDDFGGVARFASVVDQVRTEVGDSHPLLLVTSGDNFLAGPEWTASMEKGVPFYDAIAMDLIGYDAMCIGNHDFDFGPDTLADFIESFTTSQVPFLSANLDFTAEARLQALVDADRIAASVVIEVDGEEFGIVGATTPNLTFISSPRDVVVGQDVQAAVQAEIDALEAAGVNKIILISHLQGIEEDMALAPQLSGVDVMIAGGGDELLANPGDLLVPGDEEDIYGPYPIVVQNADGADVPVVTTSGQYEYLGRLEVSFDAEGDVVSFGGGPIRVAGGEQPDAVEPDADIQAQVVDPVEAFVADLAENVIATSEVALDGQRNSVRSMETNEGDLIADSFLWKATQLHAGFGAPAPDIAMCNGGGIRNSSVIPAGDITELDTFDMLPFSNFLTIVPDVTPEDFLALLENAVSALDAEGNPTGAGTGRFAQIAGFSFTYDSSLDAGSRVQEAALDDGTVMITGGAIALTARNVSVAIVDFLARGGDEYFGGPPGRDEFFILGTSYQQALADYIQASAAEGGLEGLITAAQYPEGGEGRIVKTLAEPPELVHLSWAEDDVYHTIAAVWWTEAAAETTMVYDTVSHEDASDYQFTASGEAYSIAPEEDRHGNAITTAFPGQFHEVDLEGLDPGTLYYFRVGGGGVWSREWSFRTIGLDEDVKFVVGGDSRRPYAAAEIKYNPYAISNWPYARDAVTQGAAGEDPDFVWFSGDMVNSGNSWDNWQNWLDSMEENLVTSDGRMIPIVGVIGNHELGEYADVESTPAWFQGIFANPGDELTFALNFPNLHLTTLRADGGCVGTWWEPSEDQAQAQKDWLEADLQSSDAEWKLASFHVPYFSCFEQGTGYASEPFLYHWAEILQDNGTDAVFSGHVHNFLRSWPISITEVVTEANGTYYDYTAEAVYTLTPSSADGVTYVVQGAWGAPTDPYMKGENCDIRDFIAAADAIPSYTIVEVGEETLKITTKATSGAVLDDVTLPYTTTEFETPEYNTAAGFPGTLSSWWTAANASGTDTVEAAITAAESPTLVHLSWAEDDVYHTIAAVWWTEAGAATTMVYDTVSHEDAVDYQFTASGEAYTIAPEVDRHGNEITTSFPGYFHEVDLEGLDPGTRYYFRVGGGGVWSREWSFRTIGLDEDVKFVTGGDSRRPYAAAEIKYNPYAISNWPYARDAVTQGAAGEDPDFVWFSGDMVNSGNSWDNWQNWLESMEENLVTSDGRMIPIVGVIGNHELGEYADVESTPAWFQGIFANPGDELTFALNFPNLHLTTLRADGGCVGTWWEPSEDQAKAQKDWLEADLQGSDAEWKLAGFHVPYFSCFEQGTGYASEPFLYHWAEILQDNGADAVFSGHVHNFLRSWPISITEVITEANGTYYDYTAEAVYTLTPSSADGVTYVVQGAWGAPTDPYMKGDDCDIRDFIAAADAIPSYTIVEVGAETLKITTKTTSGDVLDEVTLPYTTTEFETPGYIRRY